MPVRWGEPGQEQRPATSSVVETLQNGVYVRVCVCVRVRVGGWMCVFVCVFTREAPYLSNRAAILTTFLSGCGQWREHQICHTKRCT